MTYDDAGREIEWFWQKLSGEAYVDYRRRLSSYDDSGNLIQTIEDNWNDPDWETFRRTTFEYDQAGNLTSTMEEVLTGTEWQSNWLETRTYDESGNRTGLLWQDWMDGAWVNSFREMVTYDESGNWLEWTVDNWDGNDWVKDVLDSAVYDDAGNRIINMRQTWNGSSYENTKRSVYTFQPAVGTATTNDHPSETPGQISLYQNYPNPFNPSTTIQYAVSEPTTVRLTILDALGRVVESLVNDRQSAGDHSVTWDATSQPSGVYFCRLEAGGFVEVRVMSLAK